MPTNITINKIEQATKKDGTPVEGIGKNGTSWKVYKINNKYSYFHFGEGEPSLEQGQTYLFEIDVQKNASGYTNYQLKRVEATNTTDIQQQYEETDHQKILNGLRELYAQNEEIKRELDTIKQFFTQK